MTTVSQVIVVATLYVTVCASVVPPSSSNLEWTVDPTTIKTGLDPTTNLSISCHYNASGNINSISLGRRCGDGSGYRMALLKKNIGSLVVSTSAPAGATFTADLDDKVITMETADASADDACIYICHAKKGSSQHWAYVDVPETETSMEELVGVLVGLQTLRHSIVHDVKENINMQMTELKAELEFYRDQRHGGGPISVELLGGENDTLGAVQLSRQMKYGNPDSVQTGYLCDDDFDDDDSRGPLVVCRMLGFTSGTFIDGNDFVNETNPVYRMDDVECAGDEENLALCPSDDGWNGDVDDCGSSEIAGVVCTP